MDSLTGLIQALGAAVVLVSVGELAATRLPLLRKVALPGAVLGGLVGLGLITASTEKSIEQVETLGAALGEFPAVFINVVFACLMLGRRVGSLSSIWKRARPHVYMGHIIAWGQYVVGLGITLVLLAPLFDVDELAGATIAIGFQGGHGTAAGLSGNFESLQFPEGQTVAYTIATLGIVFGAVGGPVLANLLARREPIEPIEENLADSPDTPEPEKFSGMTGKLTMHLALVALVITLAWLVLQGLQWWERLLRGDSVETHFTQYIPLFSVVLLTGFAVQLLLQSFDGDRFFDRGMFNALSAFGLDMVIVSALATLSLGVMLNYWEVIVVLAFGGLAWNLTVVFLLGPRLFARPWYPYALGDLGGGTATTASGLLLIRVADPDQLTHARQSYSEKQPFYEPFMGGGLVTALALPLISMLGALTCLIITAVILAAWITLAVFSSAE